MFGRLFTVIILEYSFIDNSSRYKQIMELVSFYGKHTKCGVAELSTNNNRWYEILIIYFKSIVMFQSCFKTQYHDLKSIFYHLKLILDP